MDQINQVPTGGAPEQNQPAQTPTPLAQLPGFAPKKSNVKLWVGVIGGILIVVIGAAMILGKTKTYKGSLRLEEQKPSEITEVPPPPAEQELPPLIEPTPIEMPSMAAPENKALIDLCNSIGAVWNSDRKKCAFNGQNYTDESSLGAAYEASKVVEVKPLPEPSDQMLADAEKAKQEAALEAERLAAKQAESTGTTPHPTGPTGIETAQIDESSKQTQPQPTKPTDTHPTGSTGLKTTIDETGEKFLVAQAEMGVLKGLCNSTPGAQWNEAGNASSCLFEGITFKNLQAFQIKVDQVAKQAQASSAKPLSAASDAQQAVVIIAKIEEAARYAGEASEYIASLAKYYPSNTEIQSAYAKAQNAKATAEDAYGFAQGETDIAILQTLLNKAEVAAGKADAAANAADTAANAADAAKAADAAAKATADAAVAAAKAAADAQKQSPSAPPGQTGSGSSISGNSNGGSSGEISYSGSGGSGQVQTPSIPGGTPNKKASGNESKKLLGYLETPEMWGDQVKSSTIETPEMWGDSAPSPAPKKATGTGGAPLSGAATKSYGATIQGKTGPGVLLYPVVIGAVNGLYYLARKRRKN